MRECYFDPAMQAHMARMQKVKKMQSRRLFFKKYKFLFVISAAAFIGSAALIYWKCF